MITKQIPAKEAQTALAKVLTIDGFELNEYGNIARITAKNDKGALVILGNGDYSGIKISVEVLPEKKTVYRLKATLTHPGLGKQEVQKDFDTPEEAKGFDTEGLEAVTITAVETLKD